MTEQNDSELNVNEVSANKAELNSSEVSSSELSSNEVSANEAEPNSSELLETEHTIPLEWMGQPLFYAEAAWLSNKPVTLERKNELKEFLQMLKATGRLDSFKLPKGFEGNISRAQFIEEVMSDDLENDVEVTQPYPGWFINFSVDETEPTYSLEDAKTIIKSMIKSWSLTANPAERDVFPAPIWLGKSDRKKLIQEFEQSPILEPEQEDEGFVVKFLKIFSEQVALSISITTTLDYPRFFTTTRAENDPIRTLVGKECIFRQRKMQDLDSDWQVISKGIVGYTDEHLNVGEFIMDTPKNIAIVGQAHFTAAWADVSQEHVYNLTINQDIPEVSMQTSLEETSLEETPSGETP